MHDKIKSIDIGMPPEIVYVESHEFQNLNARLLGRVYPPFLEQLMKNCNNNQTKAANLMGVNRGTLRKMLKKYHPDFTPNLSNFQKFKINKNKC